MAPQAPEHIAGDFIKIKIFFGFAVFAFGMSIIVPTTVYRQLYQSMELLHFQNDPSNSIEVYRRHREPPPPLVLNESIQLLHQNVTRIRAAAQQRVAKRPPQSPFLKYPRQAKRLQQKARICHDMYHIKPPVNISRNTLQGARFDTTYYNDYFKFYITASCNAGISFWRDSIRQLHRITTVMKHHISYKDFMLSTLPTVDFNTRMQIPNYYKVIFARNPLARFVSAFHVTMKDYNKAPQYREKARQIVKLYRFNATEDEIKAGNVTFSEFTRYVTDHQDDEDYFWYPAVKRLKACLIPYDFIGKMETIKTDSDVLFRTLQIEDIVSLSGITIYQRELTEIAMLRQYYSQLSAELFQRFVQFYEVDFRVFGYPIPQNPNELGSKDHLRGF